MQRSLFQRNVVPLSVLFKTQNRVSSLSRIYCVIKRRSYFVKIFSPFTLKNWPYFQKNIFRLLLCDSVRSFYVVDIPVFSICGKSVASLKTFLFPLLGEF